jgi:hypothetical protein
MATALLTTDLFDEADYDIGHRLDGFAKWMAHPEKAGEFTEDVKKFMTLGRATTTHPANRKERHEIFHKIIDAV